MIYVKECNNCGVEFQTENHSIKSCSQECRKQHRIKAHQLSLKNRAIERKCNFCGNIFIRARERNGFCNRSCASKFYVQNGTYDKWRTRTNEKTGTIKKCEICNKEFYVTSKSTRKNARFCSMKCKGKAFKGIKLLTREITDEERKEWAKKSSETLQKRYGVTNSWMLAKHHNLSGPQKQIMNYLKNKYSDYTIFTDFGIEKSHKKYKVDFLIKEINLIIEFNGSYWHCDPRFYEKDYFNKKKGLNAEQIWDYDYQRKTFLEGLGYKVIVIWEHDYKTNQDATLTNINETINGQKTNLYDFRSSVNQPEINGGSKIG